MAEPNIRVFVLGSAGANKIYNLILTKKHEANLIGGKLLDGATEALAAIEEGDVGEEG